MKKTLNVLGVMLLAVLAGSFLVMSCGSPTNGDPGGPGQTGATAGLINEAAVSAALLESLFYAADIVTLGPKVETVEGVVPAKGKLIVAKNSSVAVLSDSSLEVNGALEIREDAGLDASYVNSAVGYLKGTGSVRGAGSVSLPYLGEGGALPSGGIDYYSSKVTTAVTTPGSYKTTSGDTPGEALDSDDIGTIFDIPEFGNYLTVKDITALTNAAVPDGKTLTLTGAVTVEANLDLGTEKGTLIVEESAVLTPSTGITITGSTEGNITIDGTIKFPAGLSGLTIAGGVDLSSAAIDASSLSGNATLTLSSDAAEIGEITGGSSGDLIIAGTTSLTVGEISGFSGKGVKSASVAKYISGTSAADFVQLGAASDGLVITGFDPETGVFSVADITALGSLLTIDGNAKLAIAALGTDKDKFPLTTANLGKISGTSTITYSDVVTGVAGTLTIPVDITVDVSAAGTLETITGLVLNGTLTVGNAATFAAVESLVLDDGTQLAVGTGATFTVLESIELGTGATLDVGPATLEEVTDIVFGTGSVLTVGDDATFEAIESLALGNEAELAVGTGATFAVLESIELGDKAVLNVSASEATFETVESITLGVEAALTVAKEATLAVLTSIVIGDKAVLDVGDGAALDFDEGVTLSTTGRGAVVTSVATGFTAILTLTPNLAFTVVIKDVDIEATLSIPTGVTLVIAGETAITGADDITISGGAIIVVDSATLNVTAENASEAAGNSVIVTTPVTVEGGGTLVVTGGAAATTYTGGAALVETVTAEASSTITVEAGVGDTSGVGGAATIGADEDGKKITFVPDEATTITVAITSGAAADSGAGGAAALYTSNEIEGTDNSTEADAVIDGVTLTAEGGDGLGESGLKADPVISQEARSIIVAGGTYGE
jgi:hypothetical protein